MLSSCGDRPNHEEVTKQVESVIARVKGKDPHAIENTEARKVHVMDFDKDGTNDAVVFFTIEGAGGGNNYSIYMSALRGKGETFVEAGTLRIGAKGKRHVNSDTARFENGVIVVGTTEYAPDDPMCCPSKPGHAKFEVVKGKIRELAGAR